MSRGAEIARRSAFFLVRISLFWFGLSFLWGGMNIQLLPTRVPELVGDEVKGTAIGVIVVVGLIVAIIVQPLAGAVSDRARLRWGRRRPLMAAGIAATIPCLLFVAYAPNYGLLFVAMVLLQIAANIAHGPYQGVIPDQVPREARGRASGFFGLANLTGTLAGAGIAGMWLSMAEQGQEPNPFFAPALFTIMVVLAIFSVAAWLATREKPPPEAVPFEGVLHEVRLRLRELTQNSAFVWLMLSRLLYFMGLQAMDNFIQLFLKGDRADGGLAETDPELKTTIVLAAVLLTALITTVPAGWLADRYGKLRLVATAAGLGTPRRRRAHDLGFLLASRGVRRSARHRRRLVHRRRLGRGHRPYSRSARARPLHGSLKRRHRRRRRPGHPLRRHCPGPVWLPRRLRHDGHLLRPEPVRPPHRPRPPRRRASAVPPSST